MAITRLGPNQDITAAKIAGTINFKNLIINGDMSIAQRSTSATGLTNGSSGYKTVDRFRFEEGGSPTAVFTMSQSTDVPTGQGFGYSTKFDCTTAQGSLASGDIIRFGTFLEGQNLQQLKKGTANAESLTLSFWVKSNKTGTYTMRLEDQDNARMICASYTISASATWEKKTITFAGDTTGALDNDNGLSFIVRFNLLAGTNYDTGTLQTTWGSRTDANSAVGQVNLADSTANEWFITGIQLEADTSASDFEFLPYDVNFQRCQRYYQIIAEGNNQYFSNGFYYTATDLRSVYIHPIIMRASPSIDQVSGTNYYRFYRNNSNDGFDDFNTVITNNSQSLLINNTDMSGTAGQSGYIATNDLNSYLALTAEL
jgi:hypothetical protein